MSRIFRRMMHDGRGVTGIEFTLVAVLTVLLSISTMTVISAKYAHVLGAAVLT